MAQITIKHDTPPEEAKKMVRQMPAPKKIDLDKYVGKINIPIEPLEFQKKIREEWD